MLSLKILILSYPPDAVYEFSPNKHVNYRLLTVDVTIVSLSLSHREEFEDDVRNTGESGLCNPAGLSPASLARLAVLLILHPSSWPSEDVI